MFAILFGQCLGLQDLDRFGAFLSKSTLCPPRLSRVSVPICQNLVRLISEHQKRDPMKRVHRIEDFCPQDSRRSLSSPAQHPRTAPDSSHAPLVRMLELTHSSFSRESGAGPGRELCLPSGAGRHEPERGPKVCNHTTSNIGYLHPRGLELILRPPHVQEETGTPRREGNGILNSGVQYSFVCINSVVLIFSLLSNYCSAPGLLRPTYLPHQSPYPYPYVYIS